MTQNLLNKTTATRENALTEAERDTFLARKLDGHLGTHRADGWWHVTPIWYLWEHGRFYHTLGNSRRHLKNLRRDPHATLCVDIDPRLAEGLQAGTRAVVCFGLAELVEDARLVREITNRILLRYIGPEAPQFEEAVWFEGRTAVILTPVRWLTWDQSKG
jgi:nitroimidazol reductase NimA-like FMN-containing flavoprotein (pyridoxamine 5'-phosphate oxidase superfamily)